MSLIARPFTAIGGFFNRHCRYGIARKFYRAGLTFVSNDADLIFRYARVSETLKYTTDALAAYALALCLKSDNSAAAAYRLIQVVKVSNSSDLNSVSEHPLLHKSPVTAEQRTQLRAFFTNTSNGAKPISAITLCNAFEIAYPGHEGLLDQLQDTGQYTTALQLALNESSYKINAKDFPFQYRIANIAKRIAQSPYEVGQEQKITPLSTTQRTEAGLVSSGILEKLARSSHQRIWAAWQLAQVWEHLNENRKATQWYEETVRRIDLADAASSNQMRRSALFRLHYLAALQGDREATHDDTRFDRSIVLKLIPVEESTQLDFEQSNVTPTSQDISVPTIEKIHSPVGIIWPVITNVGLSLSGYIIATHGNNISVRHNGNKIFSFSLPAEEGIRNFKADITHGALDTFPTISTLTFHLNDKQLLTNEKGGTTATLINPTGSGQLEAKLNKGFTINKKGRFSAPPKTKKTTAAGAHKRPLESYLTLKKYMENELGISLFLCYGTLLGCYREGGLIAGDDDFDIGFLVRATKPAAVKREGIDIIKALLHGGFHARVAPDGRFVHVKVGTYTLDVTMFWGYRDRLWGFRSHAIARSALANIKTVQLLGYEVDIPSGTEEFLAENYGPNWRTPQSDFKYYKPKNETEILKKAHLRPSEVAELLAYSQELQNTNPEAGQFLGYQIPGQSTFDLTASTRPYLVNIR